VISLIWWNKSSHQGSSLYRTSSTIKHCMEETVNNNLLTLCLMKKLLANIIIVH